MTKRRTLGRGLSALLEDTSTDITSTKNPGSSIPVGRISEIEIEAIEPNPFQPRSTFDELALADLAKSIKELGIIQPVTVRKLGKDRYQLISGERRFRASKIAGLTAVPAYVRVTNDQGMLEMALVENIQRQELDAIEVAISFKRLTEECGLNMEELGVRVGKNRSTVTNYLRLLQLPPEIQLGIRKRRIGMGHARALLGVSDPDEQLALFSEIHENKLSVRAVESRAKNLSGNPTPRKSMKLDKDRSIKLSEHFGTKVTVKSADQGKGKIEIPFRNKEDLERILGLLN